MQLSLLHEDFDLAADSGTIIIMDPCYMYSNDEKDNPDSEYKPIQFPPTWEKFLEKYKDGKNNEWKFKSGVDGLAFIHGCMGGEGANIKLVKDSDGKVTEIRIVF